MTLHIHAYGVDVQAHARDAEDALRQFQDAIAGGAPKWARSLVRSAPALTVAREAVKRDNAAHKRNDPLPGSAQAFLEWAVRRGYASVVEP